MINYFEKFTTEDDADKFIERTFRQYPTPGYGTSLHKKEVDGKWIVTGSRYSSCD